MMPSVGPAVLDGWMRPFRCHFTAAIWRHVLVLVCGALLAPGRRTMPSVSSASRARDLGALAEQRRGTQYVPLRLVVERLIEARRSPERRPHGVSAGLPVRRQNHPMLRALLPASRSR